MVTKPSNYLDGKFTGVRLPHEERLLLKSSEADNIKETQPITIQKNLNETYELNVSIYSTINGDVQRVILTDGIKAQKWFFFEDGAKKNIYSKEIHCSEIILENLIHQYEGGK